MDTVDAIADAVGRIGYRPEAIFRDYVFADVLDSANTTRTVALAAFTQTPPSYRSAAFAAVQGGPVGALDWVMAHRALGAPLLFVIEGDHVTLWQMRGDAPPSVLDRLPLGGVPALFARHLEAWRPRAIHRAKAIAAVNRVHQLDFVDIGLLPALEGEVHLKLARLLDDALVSSSQAPCADPPDSALLFRVGFRLLAAKILHDRGHQYARHWDVQDLSSVLRAIETYYSLPAVPRTGPKTMSPAFAAAWDCLRSGISFSNISSDDLAFVYENTLVTTETRKLLGTHRTPHQLAEYAVTRLNLEGQDPQHLDIYEPFAGAGTFLVSALRHVRELLPADWNDKQRHAFLVDRLSGDETDAFACEVAILSLILADYPNQNGWRVRQTDLFDSGILESRLDNGAIVLCNPPFEDFSEEDRSRYAIADRFYSKPKAVLNAVLDAHPRAFAFVLPRSFILDREFRDERRRIEDLYGDVELVALPERIFAASKIESSLVVAREPRRGAARSIVVRSTEVADHDRSVFLKTGRTTRGRWTERPVGHPPTGELWIPPLRDLWDHLESAPRLSVYFDIHRGIEWKSAQGSAWRHKRHRGYKRGLHNARGTRQFVLQEPLFLDCRRGRLRGQAIDLPWDSRKLVVNAARLSRGSWRIGAILDLKGLVCSQQFFGLWPKQEVAEVQLLAYAAVLNGPVANAFLAAHSPAKGIRISAIKQVPMPSMLPAGMGELVTEYLEYVRRLHESTPSDANEAHLRDLLTLIDARVLEAYDLSAGLEGELREFFRGSERPVAHTWQHWDQHDAAPGLTLAERLSGRFRPHGTWILDVFRPLPTDEAKLLRVYGV